jgi:peptidoglycan/LPS O-acetylase OafA/YrhL
MDTATRSKESRRRVDYLDGIRGWASIAILLKHLVINLLALSVPALLFTSERFANDVSHHNYGDLLLGLLIGVVANGRLGLFLLFILSGYALSVSHLNIQKNTLASAAAARYFRLMIPILASSLVVYVLWKLGLFFNIKATANANLDPTDWIRFTYRSDTSLKELLYFVFYGVFFKYDWYGSYNIVLWTIPMQLTGSFLIYGFMALFRRTAVTPWALAILITAALLDSTPPLACFMVGYLLAELKARFREPIQHRAGDLVLVGMFLMACVLSTQSHFKGDRAIVLLGGSMVAAVSFSHTLRAIFSVRFSRFLGRISFPLYLIQIPIICSWSCYWYMTLPTLGFSSWASLLLNLVTSVALCVLAAVALIPVDKFSISASKKLGGLLLRHDASAAASSAPEKTGAYSRSTVSAGV